MGWVGGERGARHAAANGQDEQQQQCSLVSCFEKGHATTGEAKGRRSLPHGHTRAHPVCPAQAHFGCCCEASKQGAGCQERQGIIMNAACCRRSQHPRPALNEEEVPPVQQMVHASSRPFKCVFAGLGGLQNRAKPSKCGWPPRGVAAATKSWGEIRVQCTARSFTGLSPHLSSPLDWCSPSVNHLAAARGVLGTELRVRVKCF